VFSTRDPIYSWISPTRNRGPNTGGGGGFPKYSSGRNRKKKPRASIWAEATAVGVGFACAVAQTWASTDRGNGLTRRGGGSALAHARNSDVSRMSIIIV